MAIPRGITRDDVLAAIGDLDAAIDHPFGPSSGYDLVVDGHRYPPKAVIGLAARRELGRPLTPAEFSGGQGDGNANRALRRLGFMVVAKDQPLPGANWGDAEIRAVVRAYAAMMDAELGGRNYVKRDHVRRLERELSARSRGAIEYKLENVSAVLEEAGLLWIDGYKPARNYQRRLQQVALAELDGQTVIERLRARQQAIPALPSRSPLTTSDVTVPRPEARRRRRRAGFRLSQGALGAERDERNAALGRAGEDWVVSLERAELTAAGRPELAAKVEWVADQLWLGYDVLSFDRGGEELHIEVKTTNAGATTAFFLTRRELEVSREGTDRYRLYRIFDFAGDRHLYVVAAPLASELVLEPVTYSAIPGRDPPR